MRYLFVIGLLVSLRVGYAQSLPQDYAFSSSEAETIADEVGNIGKSIWDTGEIPKGWFKSDKMVF